MCESNMIGKAKVGGLVFEQRLHCKEIPEKHVLQQLPNSKQASQIAALLLHQYSYPSQHLMPATWKHIHSQSSRHAQQDRFVNPQHVPNREAERMNPEATTLHVVVTMTVNLKSSVIQPR